MGFDDEFVVSSSPSDDVVSGAAAADADDVM